MVDLVLLIAAWDIEKSKSLFTLVCWCNSLCSRGLWLTSAPDHSISEELMWIFPELILAIFFFFISFGSIWLEHLKITFQEALWNTPVRINFLFSTCCRMWAVKQGLNVSLRFLSLAGMLWKFCWGMTHSPTWQIVRAVTPCTWQPGREMLT